MAKGDKKSVSATEGFGGDNPDSSDNQTTVVEITNGFNYRGATFETGKFYAVVDEPSGFIESRIVGRRHGNVAEGPVKGEVLDDPRPAAAAAMKAAQQAIADDRDRRTAERQKRPTRDPATVPAGTATEFTTSENIIGKKEEVGGPAPSPASAPSPAPKSVTIGGASGNDTLSGAGGNDRPKLT